MLSLLMAVLFFLQTPFWESKAPEDWSDAEIESLMTESPWGGTTLPGKVAVFIASARPLRQAEEQVFLRRDRKSEARVEDDEDYRSYIRQNPDKHIVIAARVPLHIDFANEKEVKRMEKECFLRVGKQKLRSVGYFPPTPGDPYLRILFPRVALTGLKFLSVGLYLPGVHKPFQDLEFLVKDLRVRGQVEY